MKTSNGSKLVPAPRRRNAGKKEQQQEEKKPPIRLSPGDPTEPTIYMTEAETWDEGYAASYRGVGKHRNPYPHDSEAYEWWRRGWEAKYYGEGFADRPSTD